MTLLTVQFFLALPIFSFQIMLMAYALLKNRQARLNWLFAGLMLALAVGVAGMMVLAVRPPPSVVAVTLWLHAVSVFLTTALLGLLILELFVPDWRFVKYFRWFFVGAMAVSIFLLVIDSFYSENLLFVFDSAEYQDGYLFLKDYLSGLFGPLIYGYNVRFGHLLFPVLIASLLLAGVVQPERKGTAISLMIMLIGLGIINYIVWLALPYLIPLLGSLSIAILAAWAIIRHQVLSPVDVGVQNALDTAVFGLLVFDLEWRLLETNYTARHLLGVKLKIGVTLFSLLQEVAEKVQNREGVLTFVNNAAVSFSPERTLGIIMTDPHTEGETLWLHLRFAEIKRDEAISGYLCTIEDQTAVRQAQAKIATVNQSLEKFAFQTTLLNDIIRTAISDIDLDIMLQRFADRLGDMFGADGCYINRWHESQQKVIPSAAYGPVLDLQEADAMFSKRPSITQTVLDLGQHLVVQDIFNSPYKHLHQHNGFTANSMLALPLKSNQQKIGAILILYSGNHVITLEETALGHQAATHIALAISKVLILKAEREQRELAETLREINLALTSTLDIKTILDLVLEQIARVVPYDSATILLLENDNIEIARLHGFDQYTNLVSEQIVKEALPLENMATFQIIIKEKRPLLISDVSQYKEWVTTSATEHINSWIGVPLLIEDQVRAILTIDKVEANFYQDNHKETLLIFTHQLALALQRAQWYEDSQIWAHQLSTLNNLSAQMVGMVTEQSLVDLVATRLCEGFHYPHVTISIIEPENETKMVVRGAAGIYADIIEKNGTITLPVSEGLMGLAVNQQKYVLVNDAQNHPDFYQLPGMEIQSELAVPIKVDDHVIGLLNVVSDLKGAFNENDVVLLTIIADQLAVAIQRVRFFEMTGRRAEELEVLSVISAQLRAAHTTAEMLNIILENTVNVFDASTGVISLIDPDSQLLISRGVYPWGTYPIGIAHRLDQGITGHVAKTGKPYVTMDLNNDPLMSLVEGEELFLEKIDQCVSLPLQTEKTTLGVFHLGMKKPLTVANIDMQLMTSIADISANALYRAQIMESLEEHVDKRTRELQKAYARLKELDELKSKFIADVTHELRTPVANLNLYLDLIRAGNPENRERYLAVIENQTARLTQIVENTLQAPQLKSEEELDIYETIDLVDLITTAVSTYSPKAEAKGVILQCKVPAELPSISGDGKQLDVAVRNVLANAINYTHSGHVSINAHAGQDQTVEITIEDSGIGIDEKDMPYIFDRFYRGQRVGQSNIPGMGLGLAFVKTVVEQHNGRVELRSQPQQGTTCTIWLPIKNSPP